MHWFAIWPVVATLLFTARVLCVGKLIQTSVPLWAGLLTFLSRGRLGL